MDARARQTLELPPSTTRAPAGHTAGHAPAEGQMRSKAPGRTIECPSCGEHFCQRRIGEHDLLVPRDPEQPAGLCPFGDRSGSAHRGSRRARGSRAPIAPIDCLHDLGARMYELSLLQRRSHDGVAGEWPSGWSVECAQRCVPCPTSDTMQARGSRRSEVSCSACGRPIRTEAARIAAFCRVCLDRGLG